MKTAAAEQDEIIRVLWDFDHVVSRRDEPWHVSQQVESYSFDFQASLFLRHAELTIETISGAYAGP